jgi:hypothetical protein
VAGGTINKVNNSVDAVRKHILFPIFFFVLSAGEPSRMACLFKYQAWVVNIGRATERDSQTPEHGLLMEASLRCPLWVAGSMDERNTL